MSFRVMLSVWAWNNSLALVCTSGVISSVFSGTAWQAAKNRMIKRYDKCFIAWRLPLNQDVYEKHHLYLFLCKYILMRYILIFVEDFLLLQVLLCVRKRDRGHVFHW